MIKFNMDKKDEPVAVDPRRIRRKSNNERGTGNLKGFDDLEKVEFKSKGKGVFYNDVELYQKKLEKRNKQLEYAPFDHDRKSRARSAPLPILKDKLVPDDLKTPAIEPGNKEKIVFAKSIRGRINKRSARKQKEK